MISSTMCVLVSGTFIRNLGPSWLQRGCWAGVANLLPIRASCVYGCRYRRARDTHFFDTMTATSLSQQGFVATAQHGPPVEKLQGTGTDIFGHRGSEGQACSRGQSAL